ncbi:MAG TPA: hypothetical protein VIV35_06945 [Chitinophagaceae bacterium]
MKLLMYIENDLIEAIQLDDDKIRIPGYIGHFKRFLKMKYSELISQHSNPPDFLVTTILPQDKQADRSNH